MSVQDVTVAIKNISFHLQYNIRGEIHVCLLMNVLTCASVRVIDDASTASTLNALILHDPNYTMQSSPSHSHLSPRKIILVRHTSQHKISPRHQAPLHGRRLRARLCWMDISSPRSFVGNRNTYVREIHEKLPEIRRPQSMLYQISCLFEWDLVQTFQICGSHEIIHFADELGKGETSLTAPVTDSKLILTITDQERWASAVWIDSSVSNFRFAEVQIKQRRGNKAWELMADTEIERADTSRNFIWPSDCELWRMDFSLNPRYSILVHRPQGILSSWSLGRNNSQFHCTGVS